MYHPTPSAHVIGSNEDLLTEILLRLPNKSLLRFKSVSKTWLSLISNPHFSRRRNSLSGLLLRRPSPIGLNPEFDFVPLDDHNSARAPFRSLAFADDPSGIDILQSCNGLFCCYTFGVDKHDRRYYVYNPTTRQYTTLPNCPRPSYAFVLGLCFAFDPSKSTDHFKVVIVWDHEIWYEFEKLDSNKQIEVYSSETGLWKVVGHGFLFTACSSINFDRGVFWNGAVHWIGYKQAALCFDVDRQRLREMPMPRLPFGYRERNVGYFGESRQHLHLVEIYGPHTTQFNVYEMERDYSEWFVKFRVDIDTVTSAIPEIRGGGTWRATLGCSPGQFQILIPPLPPMMVRHESHFNPIDAEGYGFGVLYVVRGETEEESFLVLHLPGAAIRYNLNDKTYKVLCDIEGSPGRMQAFLCLPIY